MAIAILGGGASGLTTARALSDLGISNVVVFEREPAVGGKACSIELDGRAHDLGATMGVPIDYRHVLRFSREAGIATTPFPPEQHFSLATGGAMPLNKWREMPRVIAQAAKYLTLHAATWDPRGLHLADARLYRPWADVVASHGLEDASQRLLCYRTGYGYGYDDEVPGVMYASLIRPQRCWALRPASRSSGKAARSRSGLRSRRGSRIGSTSGRPRPSRRSPATRSA